MNWLGRFWLFVLVLLGFFFGVVALIAGAAAVGAVIDVFSDWVDQEVKVLAHELEFERGNAAVPQNDVKLARQLSGILADFAVVLTAIGVWFEYLRRRRKAWKKRQQGA